jgi:(2Fe-2S) ferredoxin
MKRGVILLRMADRNVMAKQRFRQMAARVQEQAPGTRVVAAYVTAGTGANDVTLGTAVEHLHADGVTEIAVVPYVIEWSYPELYDVPDLLPDLADEFPSVRIHLARPLAMDPGVADALGRLLDEAWSSPPAGTATVRDVVEIAGQTPVTTAALGPDVLPSLPAHQQHVFVCFGRRCMEQGSAESYSALMALLAERGLDTGPDRIKVSRSKCLSPCNAAPVACAYPDGAFHARVDAETVPRFVDDVLVAGGSLAGHTFRPGA